jgi:hypothetical protein
MATKALYNTQTDIPWDGIGKRIYVIENEVDFGNDSTATGDVVQALQVKAKTYVLNVITKVTEAMGLTATATVGDGSSAAAWDASINLNAAAGTLALGVGGTDAFATALGKMYTAADTIDLTCTITSGPATAGKVKVSAICIDFS